MTRSVAAHGPPAGARPDPDLAPLPSWTRRDSAVLLAIVAMAAALRLIALGRPAELVFDEVFYAQDACWYVFGTESACGITDLVSRAHPPLGKWLIGAGILAFGYEPFGWRIAVALAGIVTVLLTYLLVWRLLRRTVGGAALSVGAGATAALLAVDPLHLVQSRVAMLDSLIVLFVVAAVTATVLDRDRPPIRAPMGAWHRVTLGRPWLAVAGVCIGAATAVKWSGAYVAPAIIGLVVAWAILAARGSRPAEARWGSVRTALRRDGLPLLVLLGMLPVVVYVASYAGRMPGTLVGLPWEAGTAWRGIWDHQHAMLDFHTGLGGDHPYQSPPWSWPLLKRPVAYWFAESDGAYREIVALGNPVTWWPGLLAIGALVVTWRRSGSSALRPEPVIVGAVAATYLPWLVLSGNRDQTFLWYLLPTLPFLYAALGCLAAWAWGSIAGRVAAASFGAATLASFAFLLPILVALPLEPDAWRARMLLRDCERAGAPAFELPDDDVTSGPPPTGWCWI